MPPEQGALKVWMPVPDLAMAYAGNTLAASRLYSEIKQLIALGTDWYEILKAAQLIAIEYRQDDHDGAEFIIAHARDGGQLAKVTSGAIEEHLLSCWIGDIDAFERFQRLNNAPEALAIENSVDRVTSSFQKFISDGGNETAGQFEFIVRIEQSANQLHYFDYVLQARSMSGITPRQIHLDKGEWKKIELGGAAEGVCSVSWVRSLPGDKSGAGIFFAEAEFGFFFCPAMGPESLVFSQVNSDEFVQEISKVVGVEVGGVFSNGGGIWISRAKPQDEL